MKPGLVDDIPDAAAHVPRGGKLVEAKARWLGHKLHVEIVLALDEGLLLSEANAVSAKLQAEIFAHIPGLSVAGIRSAPPRSGHSHAPDPFRVFGRIASGVLQIVDTDLGERFELRVSRHANAMRAEVVIQRGGGKVERLAPLAVDGKHYLRRSATAPAELDEFEMILRHAAQGVEEVLAFRTLEPPHSHPE